MTELVKVEPAIEITVGFDREGGRAFSMRFAPLPTDVDKEQLDKLLDKVLGAVERQRAYYELVDELDRLETQTARITNYEKDIVKIEEASRAWWDSAGKKGEWTLNPNERTEREKVMVTLSRDRNDALSRRERIAKLRKRIANGHAPDSIADSGAGMH